MFLWFKLIHLAAVVAFLGNITTGLFWHAHAARTRDPRLLAHTVDGIIRSDRLFTIPGVVIIIAGGVAAAMIGRATYQPGWRWSVDVGPTVGATRCRVEHVGLVLSGRAMAAFDDGRVWELAPGTLFHIPAEPHDSWVVGDEPYVSLHFLRAGHYAR